MEKLQVFRHTDFGELDVLELDGKLYVPATRCAEILGYAKPRNAITAHCKGALKRGVLTNGGTQQCTYIPESDVYRLIAHSRLPSAQAFEAWVFEEVLPSIRATGGYGAVDIKAIVSETVRETVAAVLAEVVPLLAARNAPPEPAGNYLEVNPELVHFEYRIKPYGKLHQLDEDLQREMQLMLRSPACSMRNVVEYLATKGISTNIAMVWRYKQRMLGKQPFQENATYFV